MTKSVRMHVGQIVFVVCLMTSTARSGPLDGLLPAWPIDNLGDAIPDSLIASWRGDLCPAISGQFAGFPSKGNRCQKDAKGNTPAGCFNSADISGVDHQDPDSLCDDGDQTTFNGMLCASGDTAGCVAVAQSRDNSGRWYRSPHRRWMAENRCAHLLAIGEGKEKPTPNNAHLDAKRMFNDDCAHGFSPDMNLGVLLYTLTMRNIGQYQSWLHWLDVEANNTKLCKLDQNSEPTPDCIHLYWPRVCRDDLGHYNDPAKEKGYPIDGRYGGNCVLRPTDALDFSAVNNAINVTMPPGLQGWDTTSRVMIKSIPAISAGIPVVGPVVAPVLAAIDQVPPLILMSSVEQGFSLHLDAVRVLIRMMILNPSMKMDTLPPLPEPGILLQNIGNLTVSDGTDLLSIKAAAAIIAAKKGWNPFFQLLAQGPTPSVRDLIINHCPAEGETTKKTDWLWEKENDADANKANGMGWDCVFVGRLYNKMRVRKDLADELFQLFFKYGDVVGRGMGKASDAVKLAVTANQAAEKLVNDTKQALDKVQDFVNKEYNQQRAALESDIQADSVKITNWQASVNNGHAQLLILGTQLAQVAPKQVLVPTTIQFCPPAHCVKDPITGIKVCGPAPPCGPVPGAPKLVPNPALKPIQDMIDATNNEITTTTKMINNAQLGVVGLQKQLIELDGKLQLAKRQLQKNTLQTAYAAAQQDLALKGKALSQAQTSLSQFQRAYSKTKGYMCIWKKDAKCAA